MASSPAPNGSPPGHALFLLVFPSIMLPMFLAIVDQNIVAAALPGIAADFGNVSRASLIMVSYLIAATIVAPVYGALGDHFGRRRLLFISLGVAMSGSVLCALSPRMDVLIAARALQGLGGGGLMVLCQALIGETVPPRDRARYQSYLASVGVTASFFGPVAGGFLTEFFGWRAVFVANLPIGAAAVLLTLRLPTKPGLKERFHLDVPGLALVVLFVVALIWLLQLVQRFDFASLTQLAALTFASLVSILALLWWERRAVQPLFPLALMREASIWRANAVAACHGAILISLLTFLPIYFRLVLGVSSSDIGLLLVPMTCGVGLGSLITGRIVSRTGYTAILPTIGLAGLFVVLVLLAIFAQYLAPLPLAMLLGVMAICVGSVMNVVNLTVQIAAGAHKIGTAAGSVQFFRLLGSALGTTLVGTALFAALSWTDVDAARFLGRMIQSGPDALAGLSSARQAAIEQEIAMAFRWAFSTIAAIAAVALTIVWSFPIRRI